MLETTQALVEIDIHVALPLGDALDVVPECFDLSAEIANLLTQFFDFRSERQHGLGFCSIFELEQAGCHAVTLLPQFVNTFLLFGNLLACHFIIEHAGRNGSGSKQRSAKRERSGCRAHAAILHDSVFSRWDRQCRRDGSRTSSFGRARTPWVFLRQN